MFTNIESKTAKNSVKSFFANYEDQICALWEGLKKEETAFQALNSVIAGIAGGQGQKAAIWLCDNFASRYYRIEDGKKVFYKKVKNEYRKLTINGVTARGILKKSALNAIESQRIGNAFKQVEI